MVVEDRLRHRHSLVSVALCVVAIGVAWWLFGQGSERRLAHAILDFDPALGDEFLSRERQYLETGQGGQLYENTAWSLAMVFGCEVYAADELPGVNTVPLGDLQRFAGQLHDRQLEVDEPLTGVAELGPGLGDHRSGPRVAEPVRVPRRQTPGRPVADRRHRSRQ